MDEKQIIKWGLIALGVYLVYEYVQSNGGFAAVLGTATSPTTCPTGYTLVNGQCIAIQPTTTTTTSSTTGTPPPAPAAPVLDMTGLTVAPDINDSLTGTVKINGIPTRLSIITATGQIFNTSGQEITSTLQGEGVDVASLQTAFASAGAGLSGLSGLGAFSKPNPKWRPEWLN